MRESLFEQHQEVQASCDEVFAFFSDPSNLHDLTPPWLGFHILTPPPLGQGVGAIYDYRIHLHGLPLRWRTRIEAWEPGQRFVDIQLRGPYALWHHTHTFEALSGGGTRLGDLVRYRLGFGPLGRLIEPWIARDIERIFAFRREAIARRFGKG